MNVCFLKATRFLIKNNINHKIFTDKDHFRLASNIFNDYLTDRGIDTTNQTIKINDFLFDNFLSDDFPGSFNYGDLILPSFFDDYSMVDEGPYEYGSVIIEKNDVVLDCGASIGTFTAFALSKGSEVHAFEPIYDTFLLLHHYLRHYERSKLYLNNVGLSNRKGLIDFYIYGETSHANGYVISEGVQEIKQCSITTIDEYVKENNITKVDFIKADIEGAERDMLLGTTETIKKYKPKISICTYHFNDDS